MSNEILKRLNTIEAKVKNALTSTQTTPTTDRIDAILAARNKSIRGPYRLQGLEESEPGRGRLIVAPIEGGEMALSTAFVGSKSCEAASLLLAGAWELAAEVDRLRAENSRLRAEVERFRREPLRAFDVLGGTFTVRAKIGYDSIMEGARGLGLHAAPSTTVEELYVYARDGTDVTDLLNDKAIDAIEAEVLGQVGG